MQGRRLSMRPLLWVLPIIGLVGAIAVLTDPDAGRSDVRTASASTSSPTEPVDEPEAEPVGKTAGPIVACDSRNEDAGPPPVHDATDSDPERPEGSPEYDDFAGMSPQELAEEIRSNYREGSPEDVGLPSSRLDPREEPEACSEAEGRTPEAETAPSAPGRGSEDGTSPSNSSTTTPTTAP